MNPSDDYPEARMGLDEILVPGNRRRQLDIALGAVRALTELIVDLGHVPDDDLYLTSEQIALVRELASRKGIR